MKLRKQMWRSQPIIKNLNENTMNTFEKIIEVLFKILCISTVVDFQVTSIKPYNSFFNMQSSKYSSSKSYGSSSDRYERLRDSPNGNYRSDSPDTKSPRDRDRSYQSKSSYLQKIREKERENRDYKSSRDKYSGMVSFDLK